MRLWLSHRVITCCDRFSIPHTFYSHELQRPHQRYFSAKVDRTVKWDLDDEVKIGESMPRMGTISGNTRLGSRDLPLQLTIAINRVLMKFDPKTLRADAVSLREILVNRKPPVKPVDIQKRATQLEREILARADIKLSRSKMSHEEVHSLGLAVEAEVLPKLRSEFHHWRPLDYTPYVCAQYLVNRFPEEYGSLTRIFSEIRGRVPDFAPESLLDFGSGLGSVSFAANAVFPTSLKEYYNVDTSPDMIAMARDIVSNGTDGEQPLLSKTYFRQHFPGSHDRKYHLVVSAYSLLELPTQGDRLKTLRSLWQKTDRFLVLVELGNSVGYQMIMEARDHLLRLDRIGKRPITNESMIEQFHPGHVFAPCPHDVICPRQAGAASRGVICHFPVSFHALPFMSQRNTPYLTSRYSYIVLEKTSEPRTQEGHWPRVVQEVKRKHHHAICRLCCADGSLKEVIVTKQKHSPTLYTAVRHSRWGDRVPMEMEPKTEEELQADRQALEMRQQRAAQTQLRRQAAVEAGFVEEDHSGEDEGHFGEQEPSQDHTVEDHDFKQ